MRKMDDIYQEYAQMVYRYLLSLTAGDSDLAEELTQETFFQAVKSIGKYDESCKVSTWLCGIAKNVLRSYHRKNPPMLDIEQAHASWQENSHHNNFHRTDPSEADTQQPGKSHADTRTQQSAKSTSETIAKPGKDERPHLSQPSAEEVALGSMERVEIIRKLHGLPDPYREVLYLRIFGDLSFREIGDVLGKTENWARVTYYRGRQQLKDRMDPRGGYN